MFAAAGKYEMGGGKTTGSHKRRLVCDNSRRAGSAPVSIWL